MNKLLAWNLEITIFQAQDWHQKRATSIAFIRNPRHLHSLPCTAGGKGPWVNMWVGQQRVKIPTTSNCSNACVFFADHGSFKLKDDVHLDWCSSKKTKWIHVLHNNARQENLSNIHDVRERQYRENNQSTERDDQRDICEDKKKYSKKQTPPTTWEYMQIIWR